MAQQVETAASEWSGYPDPTDPDNFWIDDVTGERVCAATGERFCPGHVARDDDPKICRHCATHVDEYRDEPEADFAYLTLEMHMRSEGEL